MNGTTYFNDRFGVTLPGRKNANVHYPLESYPMLWSQCAVQLDHKDESQDILADPSRDIPRHVRNPGPAIYSSLSAGFPGEQTYPPGTTTPISFRAHIYDDSVAVGYLDVEMDVGAWLEEDKGRQPVKLTVSRMPQTEIDNPDLLVTLKQINALPMRNLIKRWAQAR